MPLANEIAVSIGRPLPVELRPSLRAAIRLEQRHGFTKLAHGIAEGSYSILTDIVCECAGTKEDAAAILAMRPVGKLITALREPCNAILGPLAGLDIPETQSEGTDKSLTFSEMYAGLYRAATGNVFTGGLGWPPSEALAATPLEIVEAIKGNAKKADPDAIDHSAGIARLKQLLGPGIGESVR
jgi:hypothetical protein